MPVNTENVSKAFDLFVDGKYTDSEQILKQEIQITKNEYLKDILNLSGKVEQNRDLDGE